MIHHLHKKPDAAPIGPGVVEEPSPGGAVPPAEAPVARVERARRATDPTRSAPRPRDRFVAGQEVIPGCRLVARIGEGDAGDVWGAIGPGGFPMALKFLRLGGREAADEMRSLALMKNIRHANLLTTFGCWQLDDWMIVGKDLADGSLLDRHDKACRRGDLGLSLPELAGFVEQAARAVDFLNAPRHALLGREGVGLLHRAISPQSFLIVGGMVKLGNFGLIEPIDGPTGRLPGGLHSTYRAPELLRGNPSRWSDQYSLAATYYRLRGGTLPPSETGSPAKGRTLAGGFDLKLLPKAERSVLARAFSEDPAGRWPDCLTFVGALIEAGRSEGRRRGGSTRAALAPGPDRRRRDTPAQGLRIGARTGVLTLLILPFLLVGLASFRREAASVRGPTPGPAAVITAASPSISPVDIPGREPGATTSPVADRPPIRREDGRDLALDEGSSLPEDAPISPVAADEGEPGRIRARVVAAIGALIDAGRGRIRRAVGPLRAVIASVPREGPRGDVAPILEGGGRPEVAASNIPADEPEGLGARAEAVAPSIAKQGDPDGARSASATPEPPRFDPRPGAEKPPGPGEMVAKPSPPASPEAREPDGPRPATIVVWMPNARSELVVKGPVGRGNPDEWYGPKRVIHSPPIGEIKDYIVGAFWTEAKGRQLTRTTALKVQPGRSYEVDLRIAEPISAEVKK